MASKEATSDNGMNSCIKERHYLTATLRYEQPISRVSKEIEHIFLYHAESVQSCFLVICFWKFLYFLLRVGGSPENVCSSCSWSEPGSWTACEGKIQNQCFFDLWVLFSYLNWSRVCTSFNSKKIRYPNKLSLFCLNYHLFLLIKECRSV